MVYPVTNTSAHATITALKNGYIPLGSPNLLYTIVAPLSSTPISLIGQKNLELPYNLEPLIPHGQTAKYELKTNTSLGIGEIF